MNSEFQRVEECPECGEVRPLFALSGACTNSFCNHCLQHLLNYVTNCPICENPWSAHIFQINFVRFQNDSDDILNDEDRNDDILEEEEINNDNNDLSILKKENNYYIMEERSKQHCEQQSNALDLRSMQNLEQLEVLAEQENASNQPEFRRKHKKKKRKINKRARRMVFNMMKNMKLLNIAQIDDARTHTACIKVEKMSPIESEKFRLSNQSLKSSLSWKGCLTDQEHQTVSLQVNQLSENWYNRFLTQKLRVESDVSNRNIVHQTSIGATIEEFCSKIDLHQLMKKEDRPYIWITFSTLDAEN